LADFAVMSEKEVLLETRGRLGLVTLNRPKALNALTLEMIGEIDPTLARWAGSEEVAAVVISGAGERAFCAGGDILHIYEGRADGRNAFGEAFFAGEYRLNRRIRRFPKPYIAIMDGIVMGGGVGLSVHGSHRVVTEHTLFAMPETGIGLYPDVGATYVLPRLPGRLGMFLGLTGWRLKAADCLYAGLASHYVERADTAALMAALEQASDGGGIDDVLRRLSRDPGPSVLAGMQADIDRCFNETSVAGIMAALRALDADWAGKVLAMMERASPTSLELAFRQLSRGAALDFEDCMTLEYRLSLACLAGHDLYEGIRAIVVEKDQAPRWRPETLAEVSTTDIEAAFAPLGERDLRFE
jgi:enoyl-CoA hydratase